MLYSLYKYRFLVKFIVIVGIDGYILFILGFYYVKNNDVLIIKYILKINIDGMKFWLNDNDIFIVDWGFRDVFGYFIEEGYEVKML